MTVWGHKCQAEENRARGQPPCTAWPLDTEFHSPLRSSSLTENLGLLGPKSPRLAQPGMEEAWALTVFLPGKTWWTAEEPAGPEL